MGRKLNWFHSSKGNKIKRVKKPQPHPSEVIQDLLTRHRMRFRDLANALDGDPLINRVKLQIYLRDPYRQVLLGHITAAQLDRVFKKRTDYFRNLEKAWIADQKALREANQDLIALLRF